MVVFGIEPEMQSHIDNIFSGLLGGDDAVQKAKYRETFVSELCLNVFPDIYAILYSLVCQERIANVEDITGVMKASYSQILASENIDRTRITSGLTLNDMEYLDLVLEQTKQAYAKYRGQEVPESVFRESVRIYKMWFISEFYENILYTCTQIASTGAWVHNKFNRRVRVTGQDEAQKYYAEQTLLLEKIKRGERTRSVVLDEKWLANVDDMFEQDGALVDTGIRAIDENFVLRKGHLLGIAGPPKGGKTRMTAFLVARALRAGQNVCVWPLEGSMNEWIAMVAASLLALDETSSAGLKENISSSFILGGKFKKVRAGYTDRVTPILAQLATHHNTQGEKLGTLSFVQQSCYAEDFLDVLEAQMEESPYDVVVIDQLVNILSRGGVYGSKSERISDSYMRLKDFVENKHKILALVPCQLKQEAIKRLRDKPDEDLDVTAGGESAETIRTPDYVLGIYASNEEKKNSKCKFYCVATRHSQSFDTFEAHADYGACYFSEDKSASVITAPTLK